jgi:copper oxidase (laccase) domain-containing protein
MTQDEIIEMWHAANGTKIKGEQYEVVEAFAKLVARHEREKAQAEIDTLYEMYRLVCSQRDELMDQQRAQIAAMRGRMQ